LRLVNESLSEFKRGIDPKESIGVGIIGQLKKWYEETTFHEWEYPC
jgi:hypothetical protein